jgi:hypothetical protein
MEQLNLDYELKKSKESSNLGISSFLYKRAEAYTKQVINSFKTTICNSR